MHGKPLSRRGYREEPAAPGGGKRLVRTNPRYHEEQILRQQLQKRRKIAMKMMAIKPATAATMANWNSQRESSGDKLANGWRGGFSTGGRIE